MEEKNNIAFNWDESTFDENALHIVGEDKFTRKTGVFNVLHIEASFSLDIKNNDSKINIFNEEIVVNKKVTHRHRFLVEKENIESIDIIKAKNISKKETRSGRIVINLINEIIYEKASYGDLKIKRIELTFAETPTNIDILYNILNNNEIIVSII